MHVLKVFLSFFFALGWTMPLSAGIAITVDEFLVFPGYHGELKDYAESLAATCEVVCDDGDDAFLWDRFIKLFAIEMLFQDVVPWGQFFMPYIVKRLNCDGLLGYNNFKKLVSSNPLYYGLFSLQECCCMTAQVGPSGSLRDQAVAAALSAFVAIPDTQSIYITDIGSGDLLPLVCMINKLVDRGYKKFVVNAIDLRYEPLIQDYRKRYRPDAQGIYHINQTLKPFFSETERKDIVELFSKLLRVGSLYECDDISFRLADYAYPYQINNALVSLLNWGRQMHIELEIKLYANTADYLKEFSHQNDIITFIDVGADRAMLSIFDNLRLTTLAPHGKEVLLAHTDVRKPGDTSERFGVDLSLLSERFTAIERYYRGTIDVVDEEPSFAASESSVESPEKFPTLFAVGGTKPEDLFVSVVDEVSGKSYEL